MAAKPSLLDSTGSHNWQEGYFHQKVNVKTGECQNPYNHNPYNHNPYCVEILIGFVEILIGFVEILIGLLEILIGLLEILIGQFRDFDFDFFGSFGCRDFDFSVGIMIDGV